MRVADWAASTGRCIAAACALIGAPATAQTAPVPLPPPSDLTRPQPTLGPSQAPLHVPSPPAATIPPGAEETIIQVTAIELEGVTAYPEEALAQEHAGVTGNVPLAELFRAAARIEARYRRDGYILTRVIVPEQEATGGRFKLRVVEGYISAVNVTGAAGADAELVRRYLDPVIGRRPVRIADIERALLLIDGLPGLAGNAVLTPGTGEPGAAILVVDIRRKPFDAFATIGNRGSRFAGPVTGSVGIDINALGGFGGHVAALYFTTFDREQNYFELSADGRVGAGGLRLRGWGSYAVTRPGSVLAPLEIRSRSKVAGLGASYPLVLTRALSLAASASFEVSDDRTDVLSQPQSLDRQRVLRASLSAQQRDPWGGISAVSATVHKGLDVFDASDGAGPVAPSRAGGQSDFLKLTGTASHYRPIAVTSWGAIGLQVSVAGQYAADNLLALEQFRAGGESFGRGFNPSQLTGDHGVAVSGEVQVTSFAPVGPFEQGQLYGFWDAAFARDRGAGSRWSDIASVGVGVRLDLGRHLSGQFEVAVPYEGGRQIGARLDRGAQAFFRLTARY